MARRSSERFTTIQTEGGLLPAGLLRRLVEGDRNLEGLGEAHYHLVDERLHEAIARSWARLTSIWSTFESALVKVPDEDPAISLTRERWLLPLFQELGYGRLPGARSIDVDGKSYPVSHLWQHLPIHLVGWNVDLDSKTAGVAGAARVSPHGLVQEVLNRSRSHLWGVVSNGRLLRLLRDSMSLTRQAYVEFDLEAMFRGEVYRDFVVLWCLVHQSRVESEQPERCWLEQWAQEAHKQGARVLELLREGVEKAIETLGRGFLAHRANEPLREALRAGRLDGLGYYRQLLRLVYRLLFLFVAEDRELLLDPRASKEAHERFVRYYSTARLRVLAGRHRGTPHGDLWRTLALVMTKLGEDAGCPDLGLPALGSFLWSPAATPDVNERELSNQGLLATIRALAYAADDHLRLPVDYKNLGPEELGSVYEALLELHPEINTESATFRLTTAGGHERKTTGSYYTPRPLIQALLDSALDPVLDEAARARDPEAAILALKVCDPACGSGHFLIAAAHRIARRLAGVRTGDEEPSPATLHHALRDVIGHCIYGVDVNEMAVELCKVALWMEALEPGKPLSFLDHRIVCGNSLLGATPALLAQGLPDDAFEPIEGDDRSVVTALRKRNRREREGQMMLPMVAEPGSDYAVLSSAFGDLTSVADESIAAIHDKEQQYAGLLASTGYRKAALLADAWCAAFVWRKTKDAIDPITEDLLHTLGQNPDRVRPATRAEIDRLAQQYRFLHWHLAFPDVYRLPKPGEQESNPHAGWIGGFDVVLGNPPWERVKLQEKEWFRTRRPDIAAAPNAAARRKKIAALHQEDPPLWKAWLGALRQADGESHLVRASGRYPFCSGGDINTYSIFAETMRLLLSPEGRVGCVLPMGIATDVTTRFFFKDLLDTRSLVCLYGFENEGKLFPGVDHRVNFCIFVFGASGTSGAPEFAAFLRDPRLLQDETRRYSLTAADIALLNPNTHTCPVLRTRQDAELTKAIHRRVPILIKDGPPEINHWNLTFITMLHMANDSALFRTREDLEVEGWHLQGNVFRRGDDTHVPLYEAKMINHFTHRFGDFALVEPGERAHILPTPGPDLLARADYVPAPRYWIALEHVNTRIPPAWDHQWLMGWRDVTDPRSSIRTVIPSVIPRVAVGHTLPLMLPGNDASRPAACLLANLTAFVLDYCSRQKLGGVHLTFGYVNQLPVLPPDTFQSRPPWCPDTPLASWVQPRVLELLYTAWDLAAFARDNGYDGPPFRWNDHRRFLLRCELDAAFFHLYGIARNDVDYIMDTFPIVRKEDERRYNEYRTKRVILEIYDVMATAVATRHSYESLLDPPPADSRVAHPDTRS